MTEAKYTGTLRKGDAPGEIVGSLVDSWGWVISLTGTRQPDGTYTLTGTLGDIPSALRLPLVDAEPPPPAPPRERAPALRPYARVDENGRVV